MEETLKLLAKAVRIHYHNDPSSAGITFAWIESYDIPDPENTAFGPRYLWYASVCRYHASYGREKEVVCCATSTEAVECIEKLTSQWLNRTMATGPDVVALTNHIARERQRSTIARRRTGIFT